jgi:hypothetical protein
MFTRRSTLDEALNEIEAGDLAGVRAIVVNRDWWQQLAPAAQDAYSRRCTDAGVELRADAGMSRHFVELASDTDEPPMSTEQRV